MNRFIPETIVNGYTERDLGAVEVLESSALNYHVFATDTPRPTTPNERQPFTYEQMVDFIKLNAYWLRWHDVPIRESIVLAAIKFFNVQAGLVSPNFAPEDYYVHYTEVLELSYYGESIPGVNPFRTKTDQETDTEYKFARRTAWSDEVDAIGTVDERYTFGYEYLRVPDLIDGGGAEIDAFMNDPINNTIDFGWYAGAYPNLVCIVAWIFRTRGHHYFETYLTTYRNVYRRCGYEPDDVEISFQQLATVATHAIYPVILEEFWTLRKDTLTCSGTLVKRWSSFPAGVAFVSATRNGIRDILTAFPVVYDRHKDTIDQLYDLYQRVRLTRYEYSINHRYYGVRHEEVDESLFSSLASITIGVYREFVPNSPLLQSRSLIRLSDNSPVVGAVLGTVFRTISRDPTYSIKYIST